MFLAAPNNNTFNHLANELKTYHSPYKERFGIQVFLNAMFPRCNKTFSQTKLAQGRPGCWGFHLDPRHNKFTRELKSTEISLLTNGTEDQYPYFSIHYSGDWDKLAKPWQSGCM